MYSSQFLKFVFILFFLIGIFHNSQANAEEHQKNIAHDQALAAARPQTLKQMLSRRSLYDPAFGDSWSNYLEKKRSLFDPAYGDWANSFKRSDE